MALSIDSKSTVFKDIKSFKRHLQSNGHTTKAVLDDATMDRVGALVTADKRYTLTPPDELRYLEGLLELPLGQLKEFGIIPAAGHETCWCGRIPTALDVVVTALRQGIHGKPLIRDTFIGMQNVFEMAEKGRDAACISCGRLVTAAVYHYKRSYLYA
jgi:hypothetical protein